MDKELLTTFVSQGYTIQEISQKVGKSHTAVRYWLDKYGLKTKGATTLISVLDNISEDVLRTIVKRSNSRSDVLRELFPAKALRGYMYERLDNKLNEFSIATDHFAPYSARTNKVEKKAVLVDNCTAPKSVARRIIRATIDMTRCVICGLEDTWNGAPLVLQIDHINGRSNDNRIENLRALCPNCHSQTDTYTGRNNKKHVATTCCDCEATITQGSKRCRPCANLARRTTKPKILWPSCADLTSRLASSSYVQVGKDLGVSDNAVRNHVKMYCSC